MEKKFTTKVSIFSLSVDGIRLVLYVEGVIRLTYQGLPGGMWLRGA
jgi:hypothetical protein